MKVLFATDTHVNSEHFASVLDEADRRDVEAIILGGDLFPFKGSRNLLNVLRMQKDYVQGEFLPAIERWKKKRSWVGVYLDLGNDDFKSVRSLLEEADGGLFHLLHQRSHPLADGLSIMGYQNVPVTPFKLKDWERVDHTGWRVPPGSRLEGFVSHGETIKPITLDANSDDTIEQELSKMASQARSPFIFVSHSPPLGVLDRCTDSTHVGSPAILSFIHKYQPMLSLHGHIHEAPRTTGRFWSQVDRTICINPGQEHNMRFITVDTNRVLETLTLHQHGCPSVMYPGLDTVQR